MGKQDLHRGKCLTEQTPTARSEISKAHLFSLMQVHWGFAVQYVSSLLDQCHMFRKTLWFEGLIFFFFYYSDPLCTVEDTPHWRSWRQQLPKFPCFLFYFYFGHPQTKPRPTVQSLRLAAESGSGKTPQIPSFMHTRLRPGVIILSDSTEQVIMWKLNIPLEEH